MSFEIQESTPEATRNEADRVRTEGRRATMSINGGTKKLELNPRIREVLDKEGYLYWGRDIPGELENLEDLGYRYVTNREAYGDARHGELDDRVKVFGGIKDKQGNPMYQYLMLQPWDWREEDLKVIRDHNDNLDKRITREGADIKHGYGFKVKYGRDKS